MANKKKKKKKKEMSVSLIEGGVEFSRKLSRGTIFELNFKGE